MAAERISSSTHSRKAPNTTASPPISTTNVGVAGPPVAGPDSAAMVDPKKWLVSSPAPRATVALIESVRASPSCTNLTATAVSRMARGTLTVTERMSMDGLCRWMAWITPKNSRGTMTTPASPAMVRKWSANHEAPRSTEVVASRNDPICPSSQTPPADTQPAMASSTPDTPNPAIWLAAVPAIPPAA